MKFFLLFMGRLAEIRTAYVFSAVEGPKYSAPPEYSTELVGDQINLSQTPYLKSCAQSLLKKSFQGKISIPSLFISRVSLQTTILRLNEISSLRALNPFRSSD